jgi:hypothetical protein
VRTTKPDITHCALSRARRKPCQDRGQRHAFRGVTLPKLPQSVIIGVFFVNRIDIFESERQAIAPTSIPAGRG